MNRSELSKPFKSGDLITAEFLDALRESARQTGIPSGGSPAQVEEDGEVRRFPRREDDRRSWYECEHEDEDETIGPYSLVEVYGAYVRDGAVVLLTRAPSSSSTLFAANESDEITDGRGWVKRVTGYDPVLVRCTADVSSGDTLDVVDDGSVEPGSNALDALTDASDADPGPVLTYVVLRAASGVQVIRFRLLGPDEEGYDCDSCSATGVVLARPPGVSRVTGEDEYNHVRLRDFTGGHLTEPAEDLADKVGYAVLLYGARALSCEPPGYYGEEDIDVHWEIMTLEKLDANFCGEPFEY